MNKLDIANEESRIKSAYERRIEPAGYYSLFDPGNLFVIQERERLLLKRLRRHGLDSLADKRLLEIGCGSGLWLREFIKWGMEPSNVTGVELRPVALSRAATLCPQGVTLKCENGVSVSFYDESFDIVLQSLVFTSILDDGVRRQVAQEMLRVVKRTGFVLWYDFHVDNPWNPDVRGVPKGEITRLFPNCRIELERVTLALPLVKLLAPWSWGLCHLLSRLRILNTHYLGIIQKK